MDPARRLERRGVRRPRPLWPGAGGDRPPRVPAGVPGRRHPTRRGPPARRAATSDEVRSWEQLPHLDPPAPATRADTAPRAPAVPPEPAPAPALTWAELDRPATPAPVPSSIDLRDGRGPVAATSAPVGPGPVRRRLSAMAHTVSADLAVHWFADLGALLLFVGLFGFVAFAFADVQVGWRPVAEVAIPLTLFGVSAFLRRRGTPAVADVLVLLGGAMVPIVLIAAFSDGATPPPDLHGAALAATLAGALGAVSLVLALVTWRRPASPLRFLVAPMAWLGVAAAGLGWGRAVPTGSDLATPTAAQWSAVLVAIALSAAFARSLAGTPVGPARCSCPAGRAWWWPSSSQPPRRVSRAGRSALWWWAPRRPLPRSRCSPGAGSCRRPSRRPLSPRAQRLRSPTPGGRRGPPQWSWRSRSSAPRPVPTRVRPRSCRSGCSLHRPAPGRSRWVSSRRCRGSPSPRAAACGCGLRSATTGRRCSRPAVWRIGLWVALVPVATASATAISVAVAQVGLAALVARRWRSPHAPGPGGPTSSGRRGCRPWPARLWIWLLVTLPPAACAAHVAAALLILAFALAPKLAGAPTVDRHGGGRAHGRRPVVAGRRESAGRCVRPRGDRRHAGGGRRGAPAPPRRSCRPDRAAHRCRGSGTDRGSRAAPGQRPGVARGARASARPWSRR